MKVEIRYTRVAHLFGRSLIYGQLWSEAGNPIVGDTTLAEILHFIDEGNYDCVNAQDVLDYVVRINGFGA